MYVDFKIFMLYLGFNLDNLLMKFHWNSFQIIQYTKKFNMFLVLNNTIYINKVFEILIK